MSWRNKIEELEGCVLKNITVDDTSGDDSIIFETEDGKKFKMYHEQDCCEYVSIESIDGDISSMLGEEILEAYENVESKENGYGSETHTFYRISTFSDTLVIRWFGESNGYYSESVDFVEIK